MQLTQAKFDKLNMREHFIIYFDILGYKDNIKHYGEKNYLKSIFLTINTAVDTYIPSMSAQFALASKLKVQYRIFSDNIIIAIKKSTNELENIYALYSMLVFMKDLQLTFILELGTFIRGCIHCGNLYFDKTILFGSGLIEAVEYENKAIYPRIIFSNELIDYIKNCEQLDLTDDYILPQISKQTLAKLKTDVDFGKENRIYLEDENITFDFVMSYLKNLNNVNLQTKIGTIMKKGIKDINNRIIALYRVNFKGFLADILNQRFKIDDEAYFINYLDSLTYTDQMDKHIKILEQNISEHATELKVREKYEWLKKYHATYTINLSTLEIENKSHK